MDPNLLSVFIVYMFLVLIPINGAMLLGMINERRKMRKILLGMWKLHNGGRK